MVTVIGVRFRTAGKIYYFSPGKLEIKNGDHVIVETAVALSMVMSFLEIVMWKTIRWFSR